jgi:hypothetical protein
MSSQRGELSVPWGLPARDQNAPWSLGGLAGLKGTQWAGLSSEGLSQALCTQSGFWHQWQAPLGTDTHFPLFMFLWDTHSFQLPRLGTFTDSVSTRASSVARLANSHISQVPWLRVMTFAPQWAPPSSDLILVAEGLVQPMLGGRGGGGGGRGECTHGASQGPSRCKWTPQTP